MPRREAATLLLGQGHDDLGLARGLEEVLEANDGGDDGRLRRVVGLEASEGGDDSFEASVYGLEAKSRGPLEHDGEQPFLHNVLRYQDLVDAVAVKVEGERVRLDLVEATPCAAAGFAAAGNDLLNRGGATSHGRTGAPDVLAVHGDLEPVELVDEGKRANAVLAIDIGKRRAHGPNEECTRTALSVTSLPFFQTIRSACPVVKNFSGV